MVDFNNSEQSKVEIFVSARSLKKYDKTNTKLNSQVFFKIQNDNKNWSEYQKTEIIEENLNPNFLKTLVIEYYFEKKQNIKLLVYEIQGNVQQIIGQCECTVGQIVGAKNQTSILSLKNSQGANTSQKLILRIEKVKEFNDLIRMRWCGHQLKDTRFFGKTCPFLKFFKTKQQSVPLFVLQTNVIMKDLNPSWNELRINVGKLADGNLNQQILCQLWDWESAGTQKYMGEFVFTLQNTIHTFLDYIRGGTQLALIIAVDFTQSNHDPDSPRSLHSVNPNKFNQYQQAIKLVGEVLLQYDHDKQVPMFGFGAKPQMKNIQNNSVMHCFPLNDNLQNPEVDGMQGIMDTYLNALQSVIFSGPTLFTPLIQETMKVCKMTKKNQIYNPLEDQYFILLILTDGQINDMDESVKCIIQASHLPLSIIIIGIGDANFDNMHVLDGDDGLWDSQGNKAQRDLVQFVEFNKYKNDPQLLAEQILEELPTQLEQYMQLVGRVAGPPQEHLQQSISKQQTKTFDFGNMDNTIQTEVSDEIQQQIGLEFSG